MEESIYSWKCFKVHSLHYSPQLLTDLIPCDTWCPRRSCTCRHPFDTFEWQKSFCHWLKQNRTRCLFWSDFWHRVVCQNRGFPRRGKHCRSTIKHREQLRACASLFSSWTHIPDLTHHETQAFQTNSSAHRGSAKKCLEIDFSMKVQPCRASASQENEILQQQK